MYIGIAMSIPTYMAKGFLKYAMLRIISEGDITGYQIIKRIANKTGHKPSTGSIYPLLKIMEKDGWIIGEKSEDKTYYKITDLGKRKITEMPEIKSDYIQKIHNSISLAHEAFEDTGSLNYLVHDEITNILMPLLIDVGKLLEGGVEPDKIIKIISKARNDLNKYKR